ncbi:hypothetical protein HMPREF7215_2754 [Pyramidobacter piscolens W5455]|uniref:Bro-N domain-containing protein n=1 Tax=Pyramidobacter piscolens W5455 TaxID=352165 RepID=A0ABM9ZWS8_9BACT|nr:BRO family protein [Pyramidobacter piscolens]EFB91318.1 hypothetical protein HMPREF7215_2754 [Pyramidobacter piscolens W5455]
MPEKENGIELFENRKIRSVWDEEREEWYFSVVDVVGALTDSANPTDYLKKMRKRDAELAAYLGTNCPQVEMLTATGKKRKTLAGNTEQILRLIQSIPSPKAEPFKLWLAQVGRERIEETIDPEQAIDRALETYLKKGYSEDWVHQRIMSIRIRNELTDEWKKRGVKKGPEYAILTDEITKSWAGMSTRQYKNLKNLKKENLRDNMTNTELVLTMLAESSTTDISREEKPRGFAESQKIARRGGHVAKVARQALEAETGKPVTTPQNAVDFRRLLTDVIEDVSSRAGSAEDDNQKVERRTRSEAKKAQKEILPPQE